MSFRGDKLRTWPLIFLMENNFKDLRRAYGKGLKDLWKTVGIWKNVNLFF
tara:strand:+ start:1603 stop:1752 length:150 start_codon:yes stop_codon:yes gene_type:complete